MKSNSKHFALGRLKTGQMNKTEEAYQSYLEILRRADEIISYKFEALKFRLADNTFYTPDFFVMKPDRTLELHEVKGFWQDDARVKIKVAASLFPMFVFRAIKKKGKSWEIEEF
jgi:hypothetical protein